ncbi:peptidase S14 [Arthrobacter sp. SPG23]|uniref:AAA family ATPase n=1 Tax=Arthrobacter sp. SPG23 TaxID=1610703 RepID=UPI0005BB1AB8|nr:AAA family ATPase [Arthrobacter sp. SPG23]KIS27840.1 peptidase S14 [Arthrobacter sp. SPG23]
MSADTTVSIFYGPLSWFKQELGDLEHESLLELVHELDEERRQFRLVGHGQQEPLESSRQRPALVVAESNDYASFNEHFITNFAGQIRSIDPEELWLHNPPAIVQAQVQRLFGVNVERYDYPAVTVETLVKINEGFAAHLVGQNAVKESLLAALYPLTASGRTRPVVLMFFGPSGVGKTETAQFVNSLLGGELMRKQFSMFHSDKFASYLFGGHHSEGSFARDLLDRDSGVILIDEFDKANPIFHSAFYQLFDGGLFEDKNYHVEVGPEVIICTSNYESEDQIREALGDALFSRFDALIRFRQLSRPETVRIIDIILDRRLNDLTEKELELLDQDGLREKLHGMASNVKNVRKLAKFVDEVLSLQLVRALITRPSNTELSASE